MFPERFPVKFFIAFMLSIVGSGCFKATNESEKINSKLNLSAAINFIMESVNSSNVRVVGCNSYFQNDFNELSENWRENVSSTLLNVEKQYEHTNKQTKIPENDFVVMFIDQQYARCLRRFMGNTKYQIRKHKMVVIFKTEDCDNTGSLKELSSFLWANKILNFIILRDCNNSTMSEDVHSYFPFANGKCRQFSEANIKKLGTFYFHTPDSIHFHPEHNLNDNDVDTFTTNYLPFFPNKVPLNLNNCEIIVSTGIWPPCVINVTSNEPGIEMGFVFTLSKHMNASITVVVDSDSWFGLAHDVNKEHDGRLALLKREEFDLMVGSVPTHITIFRDFDTTQCYLPNSIAFIVPTAEVFPSSLILWSMLEKHTKFFLLIVGVVLLLSIFVNLLIRTTWKMRLNNKPKKSFLNNTLATFLIFLRSLIETSTPTFPENRTIQWIYGMWFGACLIISCYFNTTLTSFFTEPGRLKQLETVQEIIDSNIQIAVNALYYPILTSDPVQEKYLIANNLNCTVVIGLKLTAMGGAATFTDVIRAEHIATQWVSSSGEKSIQIIATGDLKYCHNIVLHRGNAFTDRINDLVKRITQSGYWESERRRYYSRRLIRIMIRQYLMVSNYRQGISNEKLIQQLNKDFLEIKDSHTMDMGLVSEKFMVETNEQEIIQRFVRTDKTLITWDHLSTVFRLWAIGMVTAGIVFLLERLFYYLS